MALQRTVAMMQLRIAEFDEASDDLEARNTRLTEAADEMAQSSSTLKEPQTRGGWLPKVAMLMEAL